MEKYLTDKDLNDLGQALSTFYDSHGHYFKIENREITVEGFNSMYHTITKGYIDENGNIVLDRGDLARLSKKLKPWALPQTYEVRKVNLKPLDPDW